ncbi:MAG: hypothetical protein G01um101416_789 [Microgenomates group bacterium Gr01-1014_16]|nr:MAG: hypothetical protein G01um101416_789 [Microgenomates group bacterium Gr01-1014_16]
MAKPGSSCYLDTNVLLYFVHKDSPFHFDAKKTISRIRKSSVIPVISPLCLDEFIYHLNLDTSTIKNQVKKILRIPNIQVVNPPNEPRYQLKIPNLMNKFKLKPRDAYHLLTAKHYKIKYFDHDFDLVFASRTLTQFLTPS